MQDRQALSRTVAFASTIGDEAELLWDGVLQSISPSPELVQPPRVVAEYTGLADGAPAVRAVLSLQ